MHAFRFVGKIKRVLSLKNKGILVRQRNLIPYPEVNIILPYLYKSCDKERSIASKSVRYRQCTVWVYRYKSRRRDVNRKKQRVEVGVGCVPSSLHPFFFPAILLRAELHISWHRPHDLNAWNRLMLLSKIQLELLLRILGGGVPPGSPNPDPISDEKNVIFQPLFQTRSLKSIPVFRPGH